MTKTGQKAWVFIDNQTNAASDIITTGSTVAGTKYFVLAKASNSTIPVPAGSFFVSPASGTQISLASGDRLFKITEDRFCKTSVSFEFSQGAVDVSDDCNPGASINDGIVAISGSLGGLFQYNETTEEFDNVSNVLLNRFMDVVQDNKTGTYVLSPRSDSQFFLLTLLNAEGKGTVENWLFVPINITSMSLGLGNADPQSREISFQKGEGNAVIYKRVK
jgi:hypothetical protein